MKFNYIQPRTRIKESRLKKHLRFWKFYLSLTIIAFVVGYIIILGTVEFTQRLFSFVAEAPTKAVAVEKTATESAKLEPTEREQIDAYIVEVFGEDSDKAFKVLSCENNAHNPLAVNTAGNTPAGSRDTGVFQINEYWQKTQYKFLLNWKVNVEIAHQLFEENGKSFHLWTCGRKLGV